MSKLRLREANYFAQVSLDVKVLRYEDWSPASKSYL